MVLDNFTKIFSGMHLLALVLGKLDFVHHSFTYFTLLRYRRSYHVDYIMQLQ